MKCLIQCIRRDRLEFIRTKKGLIGICILVFMASLLLFATAITPAILNSVSFQEVSTNNNSLTSLGSLLIKTFPQDLRGSLGILSSDICIFYSTYIILSSAGILLSEIKYGKWIFPIQNGISAQTMLISKLIVYSFHLKR